MSILRNGRVRCVEFRGQGPLYYIMEDGTHISTRQGAHIVLGEAFYNYEGSINIIEDENVSSPIVPKLDYQNLYFDCDIRLYWISPV